MGAAPMVSEEEEVYTVVEQFDAFLKALTIASLTH